MSRGTDWWDRWYLGLAKYISSASKDPSTQTGAVIVDDKKRIISVGYNGFPVGVDDALDRLENRDIKYKMIVHCTTPNNRTLTSDLRWVQLGSVKIGDKLVGFDENIIPGNKARQYRTAIVTAIDFAKEPVYRIVMETEQEILTTADHLWLTTTSFSRTWRWMRTDKLRSSANYVRPTMMTQIIPVFDSATDYESGWLAGLLDGEGTIGAGNSVSFAQRPGHVLDRATSILQSRLQPYSLRLVDETMSGGLGKKDCLTVYIRGSLPDRLAFLGTIRPIRLLNKLDPDKFGQVSRRSKQTTTHKVREVIYAGEQEVAKITTSTGTLLIEGYLSHNCERNAIIFAKSSLNGATLYTWPFMSCAPCAGMVIQSGIKRCVAPANDNPRWVADFELTKTMFREGGVELVELDGYFPKDLWKT